MNKWSPGFIENNKFLNGMNEFHPETVRELLITKKFPKHSRRQAIRDIMFMHGASKELNDAKTPQEYAKAAMETEKAFKDNMSIITDKEGLIEQELELRDDDRPYYKYESDEEPDFLDEYIECMTQD